MTGNTSGKVLRGSINKLAELRGYSAYEVAVLEGFIGTEEEWLASLKGEKGDKGDTGNSFFEDEVTGEKYELFVTNGKLMMRKLEV